MKIQQSELLFTKAYPQSDALCRFQGKPCEFGIFLRFIYNEDVMKESTAAKKLKYFCWILLFILISLLMGLLVYLKG